MSSQYLAETQQLIKFVEKLGFTDEDKKRWLETLHENGIDQAIVDEIHQKSLEIPVEKVGDDWQRAKNNMELTSIIKRWRLSQASRNFKHSR